MSNDQEAAAAEAMMRQVFHSLGISAPTKIAFFVGEGGQLPTRGSSSAAGYDLYASEFFVVPAGKCVVHDTKIKWGGALNCVLLVRDRSGNAVKKDIGVVAGVVDEDYRGNIGVALRNFGQWDQTFAKGDRIAQALLTPVLHPTIIQVHSEEQLSATVRGEGGFGSTGGMSTPALPTQTQEEIDHPDLGVGFAMPAAR